MEDQYESHSTIYHMGHDFRASLAIGIAVMIGAGLICLLIGTSGFLLFFRLQLCVIK